MKKSEKLINEEVYVITSRQPKSGLLKNGLILKQLKSQNKIRIKQNLKSADGKSNLQDHITICETFHIIDHSLLKETFSNESDYEDFYKNLEKEFISSWRSSKHSRNITSELKRIRISGQGGLSKRNGYRVVIWHVSEIIDNFNYYIAFRQDKKLEHENWPKKDIKKYAIKFKL